MSLGKSQQRSPESERGVVLKRMASKAHQLKPVAVKAFDKPNRSCWTVGKEIAA